MGLCRCQKKKISNLFCYEHRVNVCEFCLIAAHDRCIVKTYLQWLKNSDFESICGICHQSLDNAECIRLTCLDLFHTACLDKLCESLPPNTAPAGYVCPSCTTPIIPAYNRGGPLAQNLRDHLSTRKWSMHKLKNRSNNEKQPDEQPLRTSLPGPVDTVIKPQIQPEVNLPPPTSKQYDTYSNPTVIPEPFTKQKSYGIPMNDAYLNDKQIRNQECLKTVPIGECLQYSLSGMLRRKRFTFYMLCVFLCLLVIIGLGMRISQSEPYAKAFDRMDMEMMKDAKVLTD